MVERIKDLLESLLGEVALDEDNKEAIIHEYAIRLLDLEEEHSSFFYPEETPYIG